MNKTNLHRIDLNLLVLFEVVLKERHVGRAAQRLNISSSAVSHGLSRLRRLLNDPLFLKTPKGVVPTSRASELAERVADILARVAEVISSSAPFDAATSNRRFIIGAPDGVSAVFLPQLLAELRTTAPTIDIGVRQLLPTQGDSAADQVWRAAFSDLETRTMDLAILPSDRAPARFQKRFLWDEDFVLAMRAGHPYAETPTLTAYCAAQHLVVSMTGDPHGFVDHVLEQQGRSRRVALTVPNFMLALPIIAATDMIAALPRQFAGLHAPRFSVVTRETPVALSGFRLHAVVSKAALLDTGVAWLFDAVARSSIVPNRNRPARRNRRKTK